MIKKYSGTWGPRQLMHLLRRSLYGVTLEEFTFFKNKSMEQCMDALIGSIASAPPFYFQGQGDKTKEYTLGGNGPDRPASFWAKIWFATPMVSRRMNVSERMVLFWHNYFATQSYVVDDGVYTYQYFQLLRKHAMGNFKKLLRDMTVDPCMLVYLNGNTNTKDTPNENYARLLQELYTVGDRSATYTESDVKAAAKVLSGWKDDKKKVASYFDPASHVAGDKKFSSFYNNYVIKGRSGEQGAGETDELIDMICRQKEVSRTLCRKLYRWFVDSNINEQVEKNTIDPLADLLISSDYEVVPVLGAMLSADFFYEPGIAGSIIKSPIDFVAGLIREFDVKVDQKEELLLKPAMITVKTPFAMGQDIGDPPGSSGWPAYCESGLQDREWLSRHALFTRTRFVVNIFTCLNTGKPNEEEDIFTGDFFVSRLSEPGNARRLLTEAIDLLFPVQLSEGQISHLENILNTGVGQKSTWSDLWQKNAPGRSGELTQEINARLRKVFLTMLSLPEYQIR